MHSQIYVGLRANVCQGAVQLWAPRHHSAGGVEALEQVWCEAMPERDGVRDGSAACGERAWSAGRRGEANNQPNQTNILGKDVTTNRKQARRPAIYLHFHY